MKHGAYAVRLGAILAFWGCGHGVFAQPSGGPYGPVGISYPIPANAGHVYYAAPDGAVSADGLRPDTPTTIGSAISRAASGDAVILRGGIYRTGNLVFNQRITLQPYRDERPVLKGTRIADTWEPLPGGLWRTRWDTLFPLAPQPWWVKKNNLRTTPVYRFNNDMVFLDGDRLETRGYPAELDEHSFCVDYEEGTVYIGCDPTGHTAEITAYDNALTRTTGEVNGKKPDGLGPVIRGIVFTQYAYRAIEIEGRDPEGISPEAEHGNDVVGTVLEDCTLSFCSRVGAYLRGDGMVIRRNLVSDTGTEGLFVLASDDVLLEKNVVTRNNEDRILGYFASAVKIFNQCHRVTCRDNLVIANPDSNGIWYDVGNVDGVVVDNWVENTDNGFFLEISKGVFCAGNIFVNCGTGTMVLNSSGAKIYLNTYINSRAAFKRDLRGDKEDHFGWHPSTGPGVEERNGHEFGYNLLVNYAGVKAPMFCAGQHPALDERLTGSMFDYLDHNVYVWGRAGSPPNRPSSRPLGGEGIVDHGPVLIEWEPVSGNKETRSRSFDTLEDFRLLGLGFEENGQAFAKYDGPLFKSRLLGDYTPMKSFEDRIKGAPLPAHIAALLPGSDRGAVTVGAVRAGVE